ncbi:Hypothetical protein FKW44_000279, partial [Caligus rogercresseyi]
MAAGKVATFQIPLSVMTKSGTSNLRRPNSIGCTYFCVQHGKNVKFVSLADARSKASDNRACK